MSSYFAKKIHVRIKTESWLLFLYQNRKELHVSDNVHMFNVEKIYMFLSLMNKLKCISIGVYMNVTFISSSD